jgi:hypothetical protein
VRRTNRHPAGRRSRIAGVWLLLAALASTGFAAELAGEPFVIDSIEFSGLARASEELILVEAGLVAGGSYDEAQLAGALHRMRRLPFIRSARFALERGDSEGAYRLRVRIVEASVLFVSIESSLLYSEDPYDSLEAPLGGIELESLDAAHRGEVGARLFLGSSAELLAGGSEGGAFVGFRGYRLFDLPLSVSLVARRDFACCQNRIWPLAVDPALTWWPANAVPAVLQGELRYALGSGDRALFARVEAGRSDDQQYRTPVFTGAPFDPTQPVLDEAEWRELAAGWLADSTDDPHFPRRGGTLEVGFEQTRLTATHVDASPYRARYDRLQVAASRNWPLAAESALFASARGAVGRSALDGQAAVENPGRESNDAFEIDLEAGYRSRLWSGGEHERENELWLEISLSASRESLRPRGHGAAPGADFDGLTLESALVLRTSWGLVRFGFVLADWSGYPR